MYIVQYTVCIVAYTCTCRHVYIFYLCICTFYRFDLEFEPIFASMALYDARERCKISESSHLDCNPSEINHMLDDYNEERSMSSLSRQNIFNITYPHNDIFLVVKVTNHLVIYVNMSICLSTHISLHHLSLHHLSTHLSLHLFIHLSILPSIHPSIHSFITPFIHPSIHLSIHLSLHPSIHPSIHLSIYLVSIHLIIYSFHKSILHDSSICHSIHMSFQLSIH